MVLEAGEWPDSARLELALEEHVADHPRRARNGLVAEEPGARHQRAVAAAVSPPEKLVPAAHGEQRGAPGDRVADLRRPWPPGRERSASARDPGRRRCRGGRAHPVGRARPARSGVDDELVPSQRGPPGEHGDVSSVGVDVEVLGVEMPDPDLHGVAPSQYGCTKPRSVRTARNASIAVYVGRMTSSVPASTSSRPRSSARSSEGTTSSRSSGKPP